MSGDERESYAAAGVNYTVLDRIKCLAQHEARATSTCLVTRGLDEVTASRGETAYVVDVGDFYLAMVMECLGTKSLIADAVRPHLRDTVGAIVNDLATVGATPIVVNAYFAVGAADWFADEERASDLSRGWAEVCREAGTAWGGGESPALSGIVAPDAIDLAGSAVGVIRPKERLVVADRIGAGDAIVLVCQ